MSKFILWECEESGDESCPESEEEDAAEVFERENEDEGDSEYSDYDSEELSDCDDDMVTLVDTAVRDVAREMELQIADSQCTFEQSAFDFLYHIAETVLYVQSCLKVAKMPKRKCINIESRKKLKQRRTS